MPTFDSLPLSQPLLSNLADLGFESMTPVQAQALPHVLAGRDVLAQAKTGSGKTAAFGLGIISALNLNTSEPQALVICPTRELAEQVGQALRELARAIPNVKVLTLCGGTPEYFQETSLRHGAHIAVGTPGRLQRLLKRGLLSLSALRCLVLDEADRMLEMGFADDVRNILSYAPEQRQTLLFSATFPEDIKALATDIQKDPVEVVVDTHHETKTIQQLAVAVPGHALDDKLPTLMKLLCHFRPTTALLFCRTKEGSDDLAHALFVRGFDALAIHGDLRQGERTLALTKFANGSCAVLVATDVAARGLDIDDIGAVVNVDLPHNAETYVHRIGRTGRAGREGLALSLYAPNQRALLDDIEAFTGQSSVHLDPRDLNGSADRIVSAEMRTLVIRGGKKQKLRPGDILGALTGDAGLPGDVIGKITLLPMVTYVAVATEWFEQALRALNNGKIKGRRFAVRRA